MDDWNKKNKARRYNEAYLDSEVDAIYREVIEIAEGLDAFFSKSSQLKKEKLLQDEKESLRKIASNYSQKYRKAMLANLQQGAIMDDLQYQLGDKDREIQRLKAIIDDMRKATLGISSPYQTFKGTLALHAYVTKKENFFVNIDRIIEFLAENTTAGTLDCVKFLQQNLLKHLKASIKDIEKVAEKYEGAIVEVNGKIASVNEYFADLQKKKNVVMPCLKPYTAVNSTLIGE